MAYFPTLIRPAPRFPLRCVGEIRLSGFANGPAVRGFKNALPLGEEAISHVHLGWLSDPIPIDDSGRAQGFSIEGTYFAFRAGAEQNVKLRDAKT